MKSIEKSVIQVMVSLMLAGLSLPTLAHDPKLHQQQSSATADCSKLKDMDMSKKNMNANDPVMKAMHEKCKESANGAQHLQDEDAHHNMKGMEGMDMSDGPSVHSPEKK